MRSRVVTKQRVADHGEVLTGQREVNAMLDLVPQEARRIDSRFLEPACGDGNFLAEVLARKIGVVEDRYKRSQLEYERYSVLAVGSVYGIDILEDNVRECRRRLSCVFESTYARLFGKGLRAGCLATARFILERNIIWGDALTLRTAGPEAGPIIFSEWSSLNGSMLKRRDFSFRELLAQESYKATPLFSDLGDEAFVPKPEKEYPPVHFLELADAQQH